MAKRDFMSRYKTYDTSTGYGDPRQWRDAFEERMNIHVLTDNEKTKHSGIAGPMYDAKNVDELKRYYRKTIVKYHPDIVGDSPQNRAITQLLNETFNDIKDRKGWK